MISDRKATAAVRILDASGAPMANTSVRVRLVNHEFLFGCGAFESIPFANGGQDDPRLKDRMEKWLGLFNYGTLPFYWGQFEPTEGHPRTEEYLSAAHFLTSKGVRVKGHPLCWQTVCAPWLLQYDDATILRKQLDRIHREVGTFRGLVDMWDVINEVVIMPIYDKYDNAATRMCRLKGRVGLIREVFAAAKEANPDGILLLNDFDMSARYEILIDGCLNAGVPISVIGLQSHQHQRIWGREKQEEVLSRFERFGLPIHFTENTIVAGPLVAPEITDLQDAHYRDEDTSPEYQEMQADELEKMYRNLFENHPQVTAITNWDFGDGAWLNAPSGVIRKDGSLKPAYHRLHHLIREEWTTDRTLLTNADGVAELEGFRGEYLAEAGTASGRFPLSAGGAPVTVRLTAE